jgi:hypothetical protein
VVEFVINRRDGLGRNQAEIRTQVVRAEFLGGANSRSLDILYDHAVLLTLLYFLQMLLTTISYSRAGKSLLSSLQNLRVALYIP